MNTKIRKLLSVLLSLVMLLGLAVPLAPSARAAGPYNVGLDDIFHGTVTADKTTADEGETVKLTVTPSEGYIIESVSVYAIELHSAVPVTYSEGNYVFTMPASEVQASATFQPAAPAPATYTITLTAYDKTNGTEHAGGEVAFSDSGKGTTISGDYEGNSSGTVGVYPASGYTFTGWVKGSPSGEIVSTSSPYTFTVTEDVTLYALFEKDAPGTYTITVIGGKAYKAGGVEITSAEEGDSVYILFDDGAVPAGKYIEWGSAVTVPEVSIDLGMISGTAYQAGFTMPASNITVSPDYQDQKPITVDLTSGESTDTTTAPEAEYSLYSASELGLVNRGTAGYVTPYDLDKNGTDDVKYSSYEEKFTVLDTNSVTGDLELNIPAVEYSPVTFKFPAPVIEYPVWLGITQVTSANKDDILGDGGKAKFDPETNTLTLNNATVSGWSHEHDAIYADVTFDDKGLKITGTGVVFDSAAVRAIHVQGSLTILGESTHIIAQGSGSGIFATGSVTISGGDVTATGGYYGIHAQNVLRITGGTVEANGGVTGLRGSNIVISGGEVLATGSGEDSGEDGIKADYDIKMSAADISISGGKVNVTATGETSTGMTGDSITVTNGEVNATGEAYGMSASNSVTISGGTVTAKSKMVGIEVNAGNVMINNGTISVTADGYDAAIRAVGITIGDNVWIVF